jgi:hypothetical protein
MDNLEIFFGWKVPFLNANPSTRGVTVLGFSSSLGFQPWPEDDSSSGSLRCQGLSACLPAVFAAFSGFGEQIVGGTEEGIEQFFQLLSVDLVYGF